MAEYSFEEENHKFLLELKTHSNDRNLLKKYSVKIRSNKELILLLLSTTENNDIYDLVYISDELKKDKDIFLLAVNYNSGYLYYAHKDLRKDRDFMIELFKINANITYYINQDLLNDGYFLWYINEHKNIINNNCISFFMNNRIYNELNKNPNYLDDFAPPVNCKPAKRS
jgi:hypothetical protein